MTRKKILLIAIPSAVIVIVGIVFAILFFATDVFKSEEDLFWKFMNQNADITKILENDKLASQVNFKDTNSYTSSGNFTYMVNQGENSSKSFDVVTTSRHDANNLRTYAEAILKNGDLDLFKVSYINSNDVYAIKASDVMDTYIGIRNSGLKSLASKYNISTDTVPESIILSDYTSFFKVTDEQKSHIYETYVPIIRNAIAKEDYKKSNQDIQINGQTYNANAYEVSMSGEKLKQVLLDSLQTLKADTETMVLISNKASILNMGVEYTDITNLTVKINNLIEKINAYDFTNNMVNLSVYENYDETIRTVVNIENVLSITYDRINSTRRLTMDINNNFIDGIALLIQKSENEMQENDVQENENGGNANVNDISNIGNTQNNTITLDESNYNAPNESNSNIANESNSNTSDGNNSNEINVEAQNNGNTINGEIELTPVVENQNTAVEALDEQIQEQVVRFIFTKEINENNTNNTITWIQNINDEKENNITLSYNMGAVINNSISNTYSITINATDSLGTQTTSIDYNIKTQRADQVDEIQELTDSNAVLINNYEAEQFRNFFNQWSNAFMNVLNEKMASIGMEGGSGTGTNDNQVVEENTENNTEQTDAGDQ